jgi:hypothetical protein
MRVDLSPRASRSSRLLNRVAAFVGVAADDPDVRMTGSNKATARLGSSPRKRQNAGKHPRYVMCGIVIFEPAWQTAQTLL